MDIEKQNERKNKLRKISNDLNGKIDAVLEACKEEIIKTFEEAGCSLEEAQEEAKQLDWEAKSHAFALFNQKLQERVRAKDKRENSSLVVKKP